MTNNKDKELTIIITMAGGGKRFKEAGYLQPKYRIEVRGKTLFEWSLESLKGYSAHVSKYIFVVQKEDKSRKFIISKCELYKIKKYKIIELEEQTDGQATSAMMAIPYCNLEQAVLIYNIDTYIEPDALQFYDIQGEGFIPCFQAEGNHWSFVKLDENNCAVEVREKERISEYCSLGAYYFCSASVYKKIYEEYYVDNHNLEKNEKYIAPMYNWMIQKGMKVKISNIAKERVHVLGTPEELLIFECKERQEKDASYD